MAIIKKHSTQKIPELQKFSSLQNAVEFFETSTSISDKDYAIEEIAKYED